MMWNKQHVCASNRIKNCQKTTEHADRSPFTILGYGDHENFWQSEADQANCQDLLVAYKNNGRFSPREE